MTTYPTSLHPHTYSNSFHISPRGRPRLFSSSFSPSSKIKDLNNTITRLDLSSILNTSNFHSRPDSHPTCSSTATSKLKAIVQEPHASHQEAAGLYRKQAEDLGETAESGTMHKSQNSGWNRQRRERGKSVNLETGSSFVLGGDRHEASLMPESSDIETIKRLKEMIYKLQLKDAIQRQEISKLKKTNEKIRSDSHVLADKVESLERTQGDGQLKKKTVRRRSVENAYDLNNSRRYSTNTSVCERNSSNYERKFLDLTSKTNFLMQQIAQVVAEKKELEDSIKTVLLNKELLRPVSHNNTVVGPETIAPSNNISKNYEIGAYPEQEEQPIGANNEKEIGIQTPHDDRPEAKSSYQADSSYKRIHDSQTEEFEDSPKDAEDITPIEKISDEKALEGSALTIPQVNILELSRLMELSLQNETPKVHDNNPPEHSSELENVPISEIQSEQRFKTPQVIALDVNTNRNNDPRHTSSFEPNEVGPFSIRDRELPKQDPKPTIRYDTISRAQDPRQHLQLPLSPHALSNLSLVQSQILLTAMSPSPKKDLELSDSTRKLSSKDESPYQIFINGGKVTEAAARPKQALLNNVTPMVADLISQYQRNKRAKSNPRSNSSSNYNSIEHSTIPLSLNDTYTNNLNFENLSTHNSQEKENRRPDMEWMQDLDRRFPSVDNSNKNSLQGSGRKQGMRFGQENTFLTDVVDKRRSNQELINKRLEELSEYMNVDKRPLTEIKHAHNIDNSAYHSVNTSQNKTYSIKESFQGSNACPVILSSQAKARQLTPKRAQTALENLRAKMQKK